jgi:hypothetical protein
MVTQQQIKRWNTSFNKLSEEDKRVAIAKDVIKQVKVGKYSAYTGTYVHINNELERNSSLQEHFDEITCDVCALGGLFMSNVKFNNQCTIDTLKPRKFLDLLKYFSAEQLFLIEIAFECWDENKILNIDSENNLVDNSLWDGIFVGFSTLDEITNDLDTIRDKIENAYNFGIKYTLSDVRLIAIMQNIVKNKGEFIP